MKHRAAVAEMWETASGNDTGNDTRTRTTSTITTVGRHAGPPLPEDEEAEEPVLAAPAPGAHKATLRTAPVDSRSDSATTLPAHVIPNSAVWKSRHLGRILLAIVATAAAIAVVPAAVHYWQARTHERMELLVVAATFAIGLWSLLASRRRQVVSLRGSLLTVRGRCDDETFDLADFLQRVELSGHPHKLRWSLTLARTDKSELVLRRRDVDAIQLEPIVQYYRELADRRRDRQWNELGLHGATR